MRRPWSSDDLALLAALYPHLPTSKVAEKLGRTVCAVNGAAFGAGLKKTAERLQDAGRIQAGQQTPAMVGSRFKAGHQTWNAGMKGWAAAGTEATRFKPGCKPQTWKPVGTLRLSKDGYLQRKVTDTGYSPKDWQSVHSIIWAETHGAVPAGHVVVFKPGKKTTDEAAIHVADLECLSRADLMRRNSYHTNYPPEVAQLVQLRGALTRQINKHTRAQGEHA